MESRVDSIIAQPGLVPEPTPLVNDLARDPVPEPMPEPIPEPVEHAETKPEVHAETNTIDDYGIEIPKQEKVYTESEVQAMIRDRLSRGRTQQPEPQPQVQPNYEPQPVAPTDDWEAQLDMLIDNRLSQREQRVQEQRWKQQEQETQAQFEVKFNQGMAKYPDFEQVVVGKPLTPQMVIATRGMQDPAAFIYAAAKTQAPELERIARIPDPYSQAVELGKLEERMRKARGQTSSAPKPIDMIKGDVPDKVEKKWSIDDKLRQAEDAAKKDRMRGRNI